MILTGQVKACPLKQFIQFITGHRNHTGTAVGTSEGIGGVAQVDDQLAQYSCLENSMDRRAWWATVHEVAKIWT